MGQTGREREIVASFKPPHGRGTQYNSAKTLNGLFLCREMGQTDRHTDRPQHCLSSDKAVSALTLLVGWQERHLARKTEWWGVCVFVCVLGSN